MAWVQPPLLMDLSVFLWILSVTYTSVILATTVFARFFLLALCRRSQEAAPLAARTASEPTRNFPIPQT
jgi:hypothetical protein